MYIRRVSRKNKDGSKVSYLQLAHNVWDSEKGYARAEIIYNFGREEEVDRQALERLVKSICRFLSPEEAHQDCAILKGQWDLKIRRTRSLGGVWVLDKLWQRLGIAKALKGLLQDRKYQSPVERLLFALVANRALAPRSKLAVEDWVRHEVMIGDLDEVAVQQLYRAMDFLLEAAEKLQYQVFCSVADLLNLEVDLLYFDTTSTYFEFDPGDQPEEIFRAFGYSRDRRPDRPQAVIGLAVTRTGIPVRCWVWPGNTADMSVIEEVKRDLIGWKLGRVITVVDRGFVSDDNLRVLERTGGHYIAGERMASGKPAVEAALSQPGRYHVVRDNVEVKEIVVGDGEARQRYVLVRNPDEVKRDRAKREDLLARLREELAGLKYLSAGQHTKAVCALRSHKAFGRYLKQGKNGKLSIDREKVKADERLDGKYLLRTSDDTLSPADIALGYKQLVEVEAAFRSLKHTLELRPVYHRLEDRIRAHVLLCWLALLLIRVAENQTGQTWPRMRAVLQRMHAVDVESSEGLVVQRTETTSQQKTIFRDLRIPEPPRIFDIQPTTNRKS